MHFFKRWSSFFGGNTTTQREGSQLPFPAITVHEDAPIVANDGAMQVSTVWACVMLLSETISSLPCCITQIGPKGKREELSRLNRIVQILCQSPNRRQTRQEFWQQMLLNRFLRGNSYAYKMRDAKGELSALLPLAADQVEAVQFRDQTVQYWYYRDNETFIFDEADVLHIRGPGNGIVGMSPLDYMRSSVGLAIKAQDHTTKTFRKEGRRPGILMSDNVLTPEQRAALKENFQTIVTGGGKELYILEADFKFEPLGMSPADLQLLESRKFSVQDICRWFGVPSVLVNDTGETTALGSSVHQIIEAFFKMKIGPELELMEAICGKQLFSPAQKAKGYELKFRFDALLRATRKDRYEIYGKGTQNGILTRNECRAEEGLPPVAGGDILTAQTNLAPLDMLGKVQETKAPPPEPIEQ